MLILFANATEAHSRGVGQNGSYFAKFYIGWRFYTSHN